jgi:hypothetical protein
MKELVKLNMELYKNNYNMQRFIPPEKKPTVLTGWEAG